MVRWNGSQLLENGRYEGRQIDLRMHNIYVIPKIGTITLAIMLKEIPINTRVKSHVIKF